MHWCLKSCLILGCAFLAASPLAVGKDKAVDGEKKDSDKKKESGKKKDAKKDKDKGKDKKGKGGTTDDGKGRMSLPLVEEHDSSGLRIPYYDGEGNLKMKFVIGVASRLDPDHVKMQDMQVETFDTDGKPEMTVNLPTSVLDLNTRVITSQTRATIKREDFVISGDSVVFNTVTKQGSLAGNVHMTIYDLNEEAAPPPGEKTPQ